MDSLTAEPIAEAGLELTAGFPLRVTPSTPGQTLQQAFSQLRQLVDTRLEQDGAILFSQFADPGVEASSLSPLTSATPC